MLFEIVEERKRNAGGSVLAKQDAKARVSDSQGLIRSSDRPIDTRLPVNCAATVHMLHSARSAPQGKGMSRAQGFKLESLILAQNERWRQA